MYFVNNVHQYALSYLASVADYEIFMHLSDNHNLC